MPKEDEIVDEETKAFNAQVDTLVPEGEPHPLETPVEEKTAEELAAAEGEGEGEITSKEEEETLPEKFLGDMTREEVIAKLALVDDLEKTSQKLFGKFGEVGQSLKALQEREFHFDPSKLEKLKIVDEGIAAALESDLAAAFSGQQFDPTGVVDDLRTTLVGEINPYVEQRLLQSIVPDAETISQSDEFSDWFFNHAGQEIRDTFEAWDSKSKLDGIAVAQAYVEFEDFQQAAANTAKAEKERLARSVEDTGNTGKAGSAKQSMTEEEAFNTRLKEVKSR